MGRSVSGGCSHADQIQQVTPQGEGCVTFEEAVVAAVSGLQVGDVATYGEIAQEAGFPGAARAVGNILAGSEGLPWWRVVRADGRLAARDPAEQAQRLRAEGVEVEGGKVRRG